MSELYPFKFGFDELAFGSFGFLGSVNHLRYANIACVKALPFSCPSTLQEGTTAES